MGMCELDSSGLNRDQWQALMNTPLVPVTHGYSLTERVLASQEGFCCL